ncbi:hypothetical protein Bhyg_16501 [Pseudolycoriella hygida]|uniref:Neuron-derived neurotrophic factor first Fn(III) domain-containing protein n=1 Tax=Pseudolycoriella hygida TaxID=35572 RepID=A0A9Q0RU20_9DIPT|nr:hypothetical protein Bhyg_16501 [Pseudolycoriella hygida]
MNLILLAIFLISKFVDAQYAEGRCQSGGNIQSFNSTVLPGQALISMEKGDRRQYYFEIHAPTTIKITFSSCTNFITSKIYYNQSIQITEAASNLTIQCAPIGRYDVLLLAAHSCEFEMKTLLNYPNENWPLFYLLESSKLKFQHRIKKREMIVKWNKSKLDIHAVHYCLAINTKRNHRSFCEAISHSTKPNEISKQFCSHRYHKKFGDTMQIDPDPELVTISCGDRKSRRIVKRLTPNTKYFIDLFGVHTKLENLTFLLNSSFVWFNRSRPVHLKSNSLTSVQLPESGRPVIFEYKVPIYDRCNQRKLYTIPCGRNVRLKIMSKLSHNITVIDIHKSTTILLNSQPQEKLVFKFSTNEKFMSRSHRKFRFLIGCADSRSELKLPQLPHNTTIEQNFDESDCKVTTISYCVYLIEINEHSHLFDDVFLPNVCVGTSPHKHPHLYQMHCIQSPIQLDISNDFRIHYILTQLNVDKYYAAYVMLETNNVSLPYNKLLLNTKRECRFDVNAYEIEDDDHSSIFPYDVV